MSKKVYFLLMHNFEFDQNKSDSNLEKHGIDFVEAQDLWNDSILLEIPAKTEDEPRYIVIGRDNWGQCKISLFLSGSP